MQRVPEWYIQKMKADSRELIWHIMLCDPHDFSGWLLKPDDFETIDVIQELQDVGVPCAYIGHNVATFKLYNYDGMFTTNRTEEVERWIKRGTKVLIDNNVPAPNSHEYFGTYVFYGFIDTIELNEDNTFCTITAYDALHFLKQQKAPWFRPTGFYDDMKMNLYDFITYFMQMCGCDKAREDEVLHAGVYFNVDPNLKYTPEFMYLEGETIGEVLEMFAKVGLCAIYTNTYGVICFKALPKLREVVYNFDDTTQIISSASSSLGYAEYTHVSVAVHDAWDSANLRNSLHPSYSVPEKVLRVGDNEFSSIDLSSSRAPTSIRIVTSERISESNSEDYTLGVMGFMQYITAYDYGLNKISLKIYSTKGAVVDFTVNSYGLWELVNSEIEAASPSYADSFFLMKKVLEIDVPLITDAAYAGQLATTFSKMLLDTKDNILCSVRGEPALELLDLVSITNPRAGHDALEVLPTRFAYSYDGSLSCEMEAIKYSAIEMLTYAFLMPGMYIPYNMGATYIKILAEPAGCALVSGAGGYSIGADAILTCMPFVGYGVAKWINEDTGEELGRTDTIVVRITGEATYKVILETQEQYTTFTMDVTEDNMAVSIAPTSLLPCEGTIDWGDGTVEDYDATDDAYHEYESTGTWPITLKAPITNFTYDLFRNSQQINTFTAGSHMLYLPNGTFYNCSVRNVNLMPATNINHVGSITFQTNTNDAYQRSYNAYWYDAYDNYNAAYNISNYVTSLRLSYYVNNAHVYIPKFLNGKLVAGVNADSQPAITTEVDFAWANILQYASFRNSSVTVANLKQLSFATIHNMYSAEYQKYNMSFTFSHANSGGSIPQVPYGVRTLLATDFYFVNNVWEQAQFNSSQLGANSPGLTTISLPSTVNSVFLSRGYGGKAKGYLTDVYVSSNTRHIDILTYTEAATDINIHVSSDTRVNVHTLPGYTNHAAHIKLITDGGVDIG